MVNLTEFWKPGRPNRGVGRAALSLRAPGENASCLFCFLVAPSLQSLLLSSLPFSFPGLFPTFIRTLITELKDPTDHATWSRLEILNLFICKTPLSGFVLIHRFWGEDVPIIGGHNGTHYVCYGHISLVAFVNFPRGAVCTSHACSWLWLIRNECSLEEGRQQERGIRSPHLPS